MNDAPSVSILVPIFKVERWIEKCARSAFEQTYENIDYIFVDDFSPDNSVEILKRVIEDYPNRAQRVRIILHGQNRGIAAVRNTLVEACNSEFLFSLDSDDWIIPETIELLVKQQQKMGADIVSGQVLDCTKDGETPYKTLGLNSDKESTLLGILTNQSISPILCCRLFRTSLFKQNEIVFDERVNHMEDFSVTPRLFYYAKHISSIPNYIYNYNRLNPNSYTFNYEKEWNYQLQSLRAYEINLLFFSDKESKYREAFEMSMFNKYRHMLFISAQNSNKVGFNYCRKYLQDNKHYYNKISRGTLLYQMENSYPFMRLTYKLRLLRSYLLSKL